MFIIKIDKSAGQLHFFIFKAFIGDWYLIFAIIF